MKIMYSNSRDDLSEFLNKKVIMHCKRDSCQYAGIIVKEYKKLANKTYELLVFVCNSPQCCEFNKSDSSFDINVDEFKTATYVGEGEKEFEFAIKYSEDERFINEWNELLKENINDYQTRVNNRRNGVECF